MRRITLPEDLVKPSTVFNDYATPKECLDAQRHYASEIIRHRAWHATFNAAIGAFATYFGLAVSCANQAHGTVKWFGTDESVI